MLDPCRRPAWPWCSWIAIRAGKGRVTPSNSSARHVVIPRRRSAAEPADGTFGGAVKSAVGVAVANPPALARKEPRASSRLSRERPRARPDRRVPRRCLLVKVRRGGEPQRLGGRCEPERQDFSGASEGGGGLGVSSNSSIAVTVVSGGIVAPVATPVATLRRIVPAGESRGLVVLSSRCPVGVQIKPSAVFRHEPAAFP
jgi:hypothetical protein